MGWDASRDGAVRTTASYEPSGTRHGPRVLVAHVINTMAPGGSECQLAQLVRHSGLRHEIIELAPSATPTVAMLAELRRRLALLRPTVITAWLERPQLAVALLGRRTAPRVACVRGFPHPRPQVERWLHRWALARCDALVTNSACLARAVEAFVRPLSLQSLHVIPNGVEVTATAERCRSVISPLRIGFIGRGLFDRDKGLDVLLEALAHIPKEEIQAILVGNGVPDSLAGYGGLADRCVGFPSLADPWAKLVHVDALVVPSRSEGSPNVVLEAFARKVPVVGTAAGGATELLGAGRGLLAPPDDPRALEAALRELARDPESARRRAEAAHAYVTRFHAWSRAAAAFDALFLELARRATPSRRDDTARPRKVLPEGTSCAA
jgi:glycosyltransferase involved in cell wall biosynthesis